MSRSKSRTIVAIGGGDLRERNTIAIDREIIALSRKRRPTILFVPTASSDDPEYCAGFRSYFTSLGCRVIELLVARSKPSYAEIRKAITSADIIYVGGGNTLKMMRRWRRLGVDRMMRQAYRSGTVLCGISAGAICWFDYGHSDSLSFYRRNWKYIRVSGLGLIPGLFCPHYDGATNGVPRRKHFQSMVEKFGVEGIALEDCTAIVNRNGKTERVISARPANSAWLVSKSGERPIISPRTPSVR